MNKLKFSKLIILTLLFFMYIFIYTLFPKQASAAIFSPEQINNKFREDTVFSLNSTSQIGGHFNSNTQVTLNHNLPSSMVFSSNQITFKEKGGILIPNPLKDAQFYKVEVTLSDANQGNLEGIIQLIDRLYAPNITPKNIQAGINTAKSSSTYWYDHSGFKKRGQDPNITTAQYEFSEKAQSKFVTRRTGDIKLEIYVTPLGSFAVIDKVNFLTLPTLYTGSYTYKHSEKMAYISLGKWNSGGDQVTFRDLKITRLPNQPDSVEELIAYTFQKTLSNSNFHAFAARNFSDLDNAASFRRTVWTALLYRGYDHYFGSDHRQEVQKLMDIYVKYLPAFINTQDGVTVGSGPDLYAVYGISDYLRADQLTKIKSEYFRLITKVKDRLAYKGKDAPLINMNNMSPSTCTARCAIYENVPNRDAINNESVRCMDTYKGDTNAEPISWMLSLYTGYYLNFPDSPEASEILEYITFLGFHHLSGGADASRGQSIKDIFGDSITFNYLKDADGTSNSFLNFRSQNIWPDGSIDNHNFHPNHWYGGSVVAFAIYARNLLEEKGINLPTISNNLEKAYKKVYWETLDTETFRYKNPVQKFSDAKYSCWPGPHRDNADLIYQQDVYQYNPNGSIAVFQAGSNPSLVTDWGKPFQGVNVAEGFGDYQLADQIAKNVYYINYSLNSSGAYEFICAGGPTMCAKNAPAAWDLSGFYQDSLYTMLYSKRGSFKPGNPASNTLPVSTPTTVPAPAAPVVTTPGVPAAAISGPSTGAPGQTFSFNSSITSSSGIESSNIWITKDDGGRGNRISASDVEGFDESKFNCSNSASSNCVWYKITSWSAGSNTSGQVKILTPGVYKVIIDVKPRGDNSSQKLCSGNPYVSYPISTGGLTFYSCGLTSVLTTTVSSGSSGPATLTGYSIAESPSDLPTDPLNRRVIKTSNPQINLTHNFPDSPTRTSYTLFVRFFYSNGQHVDRQNTIVYAPPAPTSTPAPQATTSPTNTPAPTGNTSGSSSTPVATTAPVTVTGYTLGEDLVTVQNSQTFEHPWDGQPINYTLTSEGTKTIFVKFFYSNGKSIVRQTSVIYRAPATPTTEAAASNLLREELRNITIKDRSTGKSQEFGPGTYKLSGTVEITPGDGGLAPAATLGIDEYEGVMGSANRKYAGGYGVDQTFTIPEGHSFFVLLRASNADGKYSNVGLYRDGSSENLLREELRNITIKDRSTGKSQEFGPGTYKLSGTVEITPGDGGLASAATLGIDEYEGVMGSANRKYAGGYGVDQTFTIPEGHSFFVLLRASNADGKYSNVSLIKIN